MEQLAKDVAFLSVHDRIELQFALARPTKIWGGPKTHSVN